MIRYTRQQELAILAGASGNKDTVWSRMPGVIAQLAGLGVVDTSHRTNTNGTVDTFYLGLSAFGIREARRLRRHK